MELNLDSTVQIVTIVSFSAGVIKYVIVNPLQTSINLLQESISELKSILNGVQGEQKGLLQRMIIVEQGNRNAHERLDRLEVK